MTPDTTALAELNRLRHSHADRNAIIALAKDIASSEGERKRVLPSHVRQAMRCVLGAKAEVGR